MAKQDHSETTRLSRPARKRNPEESKRRILDAAEKAFALRGYDGARLRDIAQEAGIHHALVHHYYGDKRGLFHEVIQRGLGRVSTVGLEALEEAGGLEETVSAFVGAVFDFYAQHRGLLRIIENSFRDKESLAYEITQEALGALAGPLLKTVGKRVSTAQTAGMIRVDIPAPSLVMLGFGAIAYRFRISESLAGFVGVDEAEADMAKERDYCVRFILSAMRA